MMRDMTFSPLGDSAVVVTVGSNQGETSLRWAQALTAALDHDRPAGVIDVVPAFSNVTVFYDVTRIGDFARLCGEIEGRLTRADTAVTSQRLRRVEIPVRYGGEFGPDLEELAARANLPVAKVVALHTGADYLVQAIGFAPGFAYLGGLPERIHAPRRSTPRTGVAAGTVGIGGAQTGVYPLVTPGGWNLIGRTPLRLFDAGRPEPALLRAGDRVKFRAIDLEEFATWR
jgi:inhibitor of KinA